MTQSGKTTLTKELLLRRNEVMITKDGKPVDRIMFCYTEYQSKLFQELKEKIPIITFQ